MAAATAIARTAHRATAAAEAVTAAVHTVRQVTVAAIHPAAIRMAGEAGTPVVEGIPVEEATPVAAIPAEEDIPVDMGTAKSAASCCK